MKVLANLLFILFINIHTQYIMHMYSASHTHTHTHTHTHMHMLLSSENTKGVRRCRSFRLVLCCFWSGFEETLVVVKPLLMVYMSGGSTDHLCGEVTLSLMAGQTFLILSLKRATRITAV